MRLTLDLWCQASRAFRSPQRYVALFVAIWCGGSTILAQSDTTLSIKNIKPYLSGDASPLLFSEAFRSYERMCTNCEEELSFRFAATPFVKNNEYFNDFTEGFTGVGFFAQPALEYQLSPTTRVRAGIHYLQYADQDGEGSVLPIFSVRQRLAEGFELIMGTPYGSVEHNLEEPVFRFDRYYQSNIEYGFQLLYNKPKWHSDLWVNWEQFIQRGDNDQEEFEGGWINDFVFGKLAHRIKVPTQLLIYHKGGQINNNENGVLSLFNASSGLEYNFKLANNQHLTASAIYFINRTLSAPDEGPNRQNFDDGHAVYLRAGYAYNDWSLQAGYWNAQRFIAPRGEFLFQSVSELDPDFKQNNRELWTAKLGYDHDFSDGAVNLRFRFETYYDLNDGNLAFSNGLYLQVDQSWLLGKF